MKTQKNCLLKSYNMQIADEKFMSDTYKPLHRSKLLFKSIAPHV